MTFGPFKWYQHLYPYRQGMFMWAGSAKDLRLNSMSLV
jgi:hypothetical protein